MVVADPKYNIKRNLVGYGEQPADPKWPHGARIAVSICLNYEEGAERSVDNGDDGSEAASWERTGEASKIGVRNWSAESHYDYGARAGFWRLLRIFKQRNAKFTLLAIGQAIEKNPAVVKACVRDEHEIGGHGYRWVNFHDFTPEEEKQGILKTIEAIKSIGGVYPAGWFVGRSSPNSVGVVYEAFKEAGVPLLWESDTFADDLPYWQQITLDDKAEEFLMIPYAYDSNDMKFMTTPGYQGVDSWLDYMKRTFDMLYEEGGRMMSLGLHCRIAGRPARATAIREFLDYIQSKPGVWIATRSEIAQHFRQVYPSSASYSYSF